MPVPSTSPRSPPARSSRPAGAAGAPGAAGPGPGAGYVLEVTEQTFEAETIRRSVKHPVVVELYSPRVATGQQLSDALAEIANASERQVPAGPAERRQRARDRPGAPAAGRADRHRADRRPGGAAVPGRAAQGRGAGLPRPAADRRRRQRRRRPGRPGGRRRRAADEEAEVGSRPAVRRGRRGDRAAATSTPPSPSSTGCCRPTRTTPRPRRAAPRPGCSPAPPASTPGRADHGRDLGRAGGPAGRGRRRDAHWARRAAFARLTGLVRRTRAGDEREHRPGPAARAVRDPRQRRRAGAQGPSRPDVRAVLSPRLSSSAAASRPARAPTAARSSGPPSTVSGNGMAASHSAGVHLAGCRWCR